MAQHLLSPEPRNQHSQIAIRPDMIIEHGQHSTGRAVIREVTYDRKLDRALRDTFMTPFYSRWKAGDLYPEEENIINHLNVTYESHNFHTDETLWGVILDYILRRGKVPSEAQAKCTPAMMNRVSCLARTNLKLQLAANLETAPAEHARKVEPLFENWCRQLTVSSLQLQLFQFVTFISPLVKASQCYVYRVGPTETTAAAKQRFWKHQMRPFFLHGSHIYLSRELLFVELENGKIFAQPTDMILLWHNKACDILSVLLASQTMSGVSLVPEFSSMVESFLSIGTSILLTYKHDAFAIFKSLEALCIGETLITLEGQANSGFLRTICQDLQSGVGFNYYESELHLLLHNAPIPERHELSCLSKVFGHPFVNMKEGSYKLFQKTTEPYTIDVSHVNIVTCHVKENFIRNYILRHGSWPPVSFDMMHEDHPLRRAHDTGRQPNDPMIERQYGPVHIEDYTRVNLMKCLEFDQLENVLPHLKDRTISVLRSRVFRTYLATSQQAGQGASWRDTRLLLAYLLSPNEAHDHLSYLHQYNTSSDLEDLLDYLVIRVVPKERELKEVYRGFGCKTYEDRMRSICQEHNVMDFLERYSDEQAMAITELDLQEKLVSFRQLSKAYPRHKILNVVIDASAWNNKFRDETVRPVMKETLDSIYGTTIFGKTHLAYQKSLLYVPDKCGTWYWEGQDGGIEGLNQDTWVVVYIAQIKSALAEVEFPYHILCKGDDVRVCFAIPPAVYSARSMSAIREDLVSRISKALGGLGHTIKKEESYGSETYFAFSKAASIKSIELPQTLRKIQKVYGASNAFIATLDEYIGSAYSNAHSSCKVGTQTCGPYYVACFWSYWHIINTKQFAELPDSHLVALLLVPNMLGGFPIIYLHNMAVRAESDLLPPFISIYKYLERKGSPVAVILNHFMRAKLYAKDELITLLHDPYALPIERPPTPATVIRNMVRSLLRDVICREEVREIIDMISSHATRSLIDAILSARPFHVKILSTLFSATPEGILEEIVRKFESCRSVMELLITRGGIRKASRAARAIVQAETKLQNWRVMRINGCFEASVDVPLPAQQDLCPTEIAWNWREKSWGLPIHGITQPPMQHIMKYTVAGSSGGDRWADKHHFHYHLRPPSVTVDPEHIAHYSTGLLRPFLGHTTRTGTIAPQVRLDQSESILVKISNLLDLTVWLNVEGFTESGEHIVGNGLTIIRRILQLYTNEPLEKFLPLTASPRGSGTIQHHVRAPSYRESIVPNTLVNVYTRFIGESDTHRVMKDGGEHYMYNFLHGYCYTAWINNLNAEFSQELWHHEPWWGVTVDCHFCMSPLLETPIVFDVSRIKELQLFPLNLTRIGEISLRKMHNAIQEFEPESFDPSVMHQTLTQRTAGLAILHEVVDNLYYRRIDLARRYGDTAFNDEALRIYTSLAPKSRSREVGKGELRRISNAVIYDFLMAETRIHLASIVRDADMNDIPAILNTIEPTTFPWYGLCKILLGIGRLAGVVHYAQRRSTIPAPVCFNNPGTAAQYLASACLCADLDYVKDTPILIITGRELSRSQPLIARQLYLAFSRLLISDYFAYLHQIPQHETGSDDHQRLWLRALWILNHMQDLAVIAEDLADTLRNAKNQQISMIDLFRMVPNDWEYIKDDYTVLLSRAYSISRKMLTSGITRMDIHEVSEETALQELDAVAASLSHVHIWCHHIALPACVAFTRKSRPITFAGAILPEDASSESTEHSTSTPESEEVLLALREQAALAHDRSSFVTRIRSAASHKLFRHALIRPSLRYERETDYTLGLENMFSTDRVYMNVGRTFQIIGGANGSMTTGLELLSLFGTSSGQAETIQAACLADGLGGMTSAVLHHYESARVTFHTRPDNVLDDPAPHDVIKMFPQRRDDIIWTHLHHGHFDLGRVSTYKAIETYQHLYHYILVDLEYHQGAYDTTPPDRIYQLIVSFILRNSAVNCIAAIKVDMNNPKNISQCASTMIEYASYLLLYKPRSCAEGKYAYLCAVIDRPQAAWNYDEPLRLYAQVSSQVAKLTLRYSNTFQRVATISPVMLDWSKMCHSVYVASVKNIHPSRASYLLQTTYHIPQDTLILDRLKMPFSGAMADWKANRSVIQNLLSLYDPRNSLSKLCMTEQYDPYIRVARKSYETHAHLIILMLNLAKYEGFYQTMEQFSKVSQHDILCYSSLDIWSRFERWWESLRDNQRLTSNVEDHMNYRLDIHGQSASLFRPYIEGVEDAICVLMALLRTHHCI
nr:MAG: RNA-dependent RNA polymerase [Wenzhou rodent chuvirus 1]